MKEITPTLAKIMLDEINKIKQMNFWNHLMGLYLDEVDSAHHKWQTTEVGTDKTSLVEMWIRLQAEAKSFEKAINIPQRLEERLLNLVKEE